MSQAEDHFQLISRWHQQLDPQQVLDMSGPASPDHALYVALDAWEHGGHTHEVRGPPVVATMLQGIRLAADTTEGRSTHLFSGFRGTGKTTGVGPAHRAAAPA